MKQVLITGGAHRLGAEIVRQFSAAGWRVWCHYQRSASVAAALQAELQEYPAPEETTPLVLDGEMLGVVMPFCFESVHGMLSLISTTTIFGTPVDVTLQELAVESFFPADDFTANALRELARQQNTGG